MRLEPEFRASKVTDRDFPYAAPTVTFLAITADSVTQASTSGDKRAMIESVPEGTTIMGVWPGNWKTNVFWIDDLGAARLALAPKKRG